MSTYTPKYDPVLKRGAIVVALLVGGLFALLVARAIVRPELSDPRVLRPESVPISAHWVRDNRDSPQFGVFVEIEQVQRGRQVEIRASVFDGESGAVIYSGFLNPCPAISSPIVISDSSVLQVWDGTALHFRGTSQMFAMPGKSFTYYRDGYPPGCRDGLEASIGRSS